MAHTLTSRLEISVKRFPNKPAFIYFNDAEWKKLTYAEFSQRILILSNYIKSSSIPDKSKIAIILKNSPEWAIAYFSIIYAGCIAVPMDPGDSSENIKNVITDCKASCAFVGSEELTKLEGSSVQRKIIVSGKGNGDDCINYEDILKQAKIQKDVLDLVLAKESDIASLLYTSGTTASSKGVILTHKNFVSNFDSIKLANFYAKSDKIICCLPLFHSYPFMTTLICPLLIGATTIFTPSLKGEDLLRSAKDNQATILVGVPELFALVYEKINAKINSLNVPLRTILRTLAELFWQLRKITGLNFSKILFKKAHSSLGENMRFFTSGGAKIDPLVQEGLFKLGFSIIEGYGLTETSPVATFNPLKKPKIGSVGIGVNGVSIRIDNPNSSGIGEILIKGENVMTGYYNRPQETKEAIVDGWFHSGDLGYKDSQGYVYITGRKKELIVLSSGKNVYPQDVETYYKKSKFIKEICIFDPAVFKKSQAGIFALIVPDTEIFKQYGETDIDRVVRGKIEDLSKLAPSHIRITDFRISLDELPKTRLGKVKRYKAKQVFSDLYDLKQKRQITDISEEDKALMKHVVFQAIVNYAKREKKLNVDVIISDSLELGLGLDSLGRIELLSMLETEFNIDVPQDMAAGWFTIKDVVLGIEHLTKDPTAKKVSGNIADKEGKLWSKLLKENPPDTLLKKIDINPSVFLKIVSFLVLKFLRIYFKVFHRLKIKGIENIPKEGPFIFCVNHTSFFDAFIVAASVSYVNALRLYFVGYRGYFEVPVIRNTVRAGRIIPVDTAKDLISAMQAASYILKHNKSLCIFPEGERSIDGKLKKFKNGIGILSKELNALLVPVVIKGAFRAWPRIKRWPRPYPIEVNFLKAIDVKTLIEKSRRDNTVDDYHIITSAVKDIMLRVNNRA